MVLEDTTTESNIEPIEKLNTKVPFVAQIKKNKKYVITGVIGLLITMIGLLVIFGSPSAATVFKDMNEKMLETKSVTIDQKLTMVSAESGSAEISSKLFVNMKSSTELLAKGNFTLSIAYASSPMMIGGDVIKVGDSSYVKYSEISSSDAAISSSFTTIESKLKNNWIKVRDNDQFAAMASTPISSTVNILPTPFANLTDTQRKNILTMLNDDSFYTIEESSKVDTAGVTAYKYLLTYDKDQYKKMAKALSGYVSYFKSDDSSDSEITSMTVWVNINTKQIIKIEYKGTTSSGDVTGTITFSGYNQDKAVEKPSDYSIESELLN